MEDKSQEQNQAAPAPAGPLPPNEVTLKTPNGHVVALKGYVSGGDMDELQRMILKHMVLQVDGETGKVKNTVQDVSGEYVLDRIEKALELLVLSVDGITDNVLQAVKDLPSQDYDAVVEKINEISAPLAPAPATES